MMITMISLHVSIYIKYFQMFLTDPMGLVFDFALWGSVPGKDSSLTVGRSY